MTRATPVAALAAVLLLAACATPRQPAAPATSPAPPAAANLNPAVMQPVVARAVIGAPSTLPGWSEARLDDALRAFRRGCARLAKRVDRSGLTQPDDWAAACADRDADARAFFERHFAAVRLNDGRGMTTGYFEPEIAGCLAPTPTCATPLHKRPDDLVEVDLTPFAADLKGRTVRGRWTGRTLAPYPDRAAIEDGALAGRGLELAYAEDAAELFMMEVQGSGALRLPDGTVRRVGYAGQNGRAYVAIGRLLRQRNILPAGGAGMEAILRWIRANPAEGRALMRENPSYVFFQWADPSLDGPVGTLGVPLIPEATAAADQTTLPLGAPVWIVTEVPEPGQGKRPFRRLLIAQDTGGAIRGANRFDIFWGGGARGRAVASELAAPVEAAILLPRAAAERLANADAPPPG